MQSNDTVSHSPAQVSTELDGAAIIMHVETGEYFEMDEIGSEIWKQIAEPITVDALVEKLTAEFDVQADECREQVLGFLGELRDKELIEIR